MAFDDLKSSVEEYSEKKSELIKERQFFDSEQAKVDSLSAFASHLDDSIVSAIGGVQDEFSAEREGLEQQSDVLQSEKDVLTKKISDEQAKIDTVQKKIDGLSGKKYTGGLDVVCQKCDALLAELDDMLKDIDFEGTTVIGGIGSDKSGNNPNPESKGETTPRDQKGGFLSSLFSKNQATTNGPKFGNFDLASIKNGSDYFVRGTNYEQFIIDYYNSEQSTYEDLGKNEIITTVSPGNIEGIHLGKTEAVDSSIFWRQHESGGTRESFVEIASHIPEVERLINAGLSLEAIRENPSLERCVNIYFEPSNIPRVIQSNGYYEFDSNGRHRILAAREAGYNIPVRIVGIRRWR